MPRLTLQHYEIPNYAQVIPNKPRSERPIQKIADLLYVLHGIPWFKKKNEKEASNTNDSQTEVSPNSGYDRSHKEDKGGEVYNGEKAYGSGFDPASDTAEEAFNAGREAAEHNSDDYKRSMEEALENARKARGLVEKAEPKSPTKQKAEAYKEVFGDPGDELDLVFGDVFRESPYSPALKFRDEQEADLRRYLNNLKATEEMNGYTPADYTDEETQDLWEREQGSDVSHAKDLMKGYRGGESRW